MENPGEVLIYLFTVVLPYYTLPLGEVGGWFTHCILWLYSQAPLHGLGVGILQKLWLYSQAPLHGLGVGI